MTAINLEDNSNNTPGNEQNIIELEAQITEIKEEAQRYRAAKIKDAKRSRKLNEALQKPPVIIPLNMSRFKISKWT